MPRFGLSLIGLVMLALVVTACGDTPPPSASGQAEESAEAESPAETTAAESTAPTDGPSTGEGILAAVQERGQLVCGVNGALPGFSFLDESTGENTGFDADYCRAIAAAVPRAGAGPPDFK